MAHFIWEIVALFIVTGGGTLAFCYKQKSTLLGVTENEMMRVIANDALLQHYFNDKHEFVSIEILDLVYSVDQSVALVQTLCKRATDSKDTIRLYLVVINNNQYSPRLVAESSRSLDWGKRLAFYDELKPIGVSVYSGHWVEATYQRLELGNFDGITLNWRAKPVRTKFVISPTQQADVLIIPVIPNAGQNNN